MEPKYAIVAIIGIIAFVGLVSIIVSFFEKDIDDYERMYQSPRNSKPKKVQEEDDDVIVDDDLVINNDFYTDEL